MPGRFPQVPSDRRWTVVLLILWLLLAGYIVWTRDPLGFVILILFGIFIALPALVLWIGARRAGTDAPDELPGRDGAEERE